MAILCITLLSIGVFQGYLHSGYPLGTDSMDTTTYVEMMNHDHSYFSTWLPIRDLGSVDYQSPIYTAYYWFSGEVLGLSSSSIVEIMMAGAFWIAGLSMYVCSYRITGSRLGSVVAAIVYMFGQANLSQITEGHAQFLVGYAFLPLLFLIVYRVLTSDSIKGLILLFPFALFFGMVCVPHYAVISASFLVLFVIGYSILKRPRSTRLLLALTAIPLVALPTALARLLPGSSSDLARSFSIQDVFAYSSHNPLESLLLRSSENSFFINEIPQKWTIPGIPIELVYLVSLIVPIVVFSSFWLRKGKHRELILTMLVLSVVYLVLSLGPYQPLGSVFIWAYNNIPFLDSLRAFSRFLLIDCFTYSILIAIVIGGMKIPRFRRFPVILNEKRWRGLVASLLVISIILPSTAVFTGAVGTFNLGDSYAQPFQDIRTDEGDYRVITIPLTNSYYHDLYERYDNYTFTNTLDVGMYSPVITDKDLANGIGDKFWDYIETSLRDGNYGYREIGRLVGPITSSKYVVAQVYAYPADNERIVNQTGLIVVSNYSQGGKLLLDQYYLPRIRAAGESIVLSGGLESILPSMAAGLIDPANQTFVMAEGLTASELMKAINGSSLVVLDDADVLDLEHGLVTDSGAADISLSGYGTTKTSDPQSAWLTSSNEYAEGLTSSLTLQTSGKNTVDIPVTIGTDGVYRSFIKMEYGPGRGMLTLSMDGKVITQLTPDSDYPHMEWTELEVQNLTAGEHRFTISNDGTGNNSLERILFATDAQLQAASSELATAVGHHAAYSLNINQITDFYPQGWSKEFEADGSGMIYGTLVLPDQIKGAVLVQDTGAIGGQAALMDSRTSSINIDLGNCTAGINYSVSIAVKGTASGTFSGAKVSFGQGSDMFGNVTFGPSNVSSDRFSNLTASFRPTMNGTVNMVLTINKNDSLLVECTYSRPRSNGPISRTISLVNPGNYVVQITSPYEGITSGSSDDLVTIDGQLPSSITEDNGVFNCRFENLESGPHLMTLNLTSIQMVTMLEDGLPVERPGMDNVSYVRVGTDDYLVRVNTSMAGYLLLSESYDPMWKATVNGVELNHSEAYSKVNMYDIPAGNYTVEISFRGSDSYRTALELPLAYVMIGLFVTFLYIRSGKPSDRKCTTWTRMFKRRRPD